MKSTQGKCVGCTLIYSWEGKPLLKDAYCAKCKKPLERTTHALGRARTTRGTWARATVYPFAFGLLLLTACTTKIINKPTNVDVVAYLAPAQCQRDSNISEKEVVVFLIAERFHIAKWAT